MWAGLGQAYKVTIDFAVGAKSMVSSTWKRQTKAWKLWNIEIWVTWVQTTVTRNYFRWTYCVHVSKGKFHRWITKWVGVQGHPLRNLWNRGSLNSNCLWRWLFDWQISYETPSVASSWSELLTLSEAADVTIWRLYSLHATTNRHPLYYMSTVLTWVACPRDGHFTVSLWSQMQGVYVGNLCGYYDSCVERPRRKVGEIFEKISLSFKTNSRELYVITLRWYVIHDN